MRKKSKKKIMLCVQVPVDTHKKFKAYAKDRDFSMKFFVIQDIERRLTEKPVDYRDIRASQLYFVKELEALFVPLGFSVVYKLDDRDSDPLTCNFRFVIGNTAVRKLFDITGGGVDRFFDVLTEIEEFSSANNILADTKSLRKKLMLNYHNPLSADDAKSLLERGVEL